MADVHQLTENPVTAQPVSENQVALTELARKKALEFLAEEEDPAGKVLRVGVSSGGCSGFSYMVSIDQKKDDDIVQHHDGLDMVIDPVSIRFLKGCVVDYVDEVGQSGFKFENPNASSSCGCGSSFNV